MSDIKPWHDTPSCERPRTTDPSRACGGPLIPRRAANWNHRANPEDRLVCCSCGEGWEGTDAEVERSERAQQAWEEEAQL